MEEAILEKAVRDGLSGITFEQRPGCGRGKTMEIS